MCITSASDADVGRLLRQSVVLATPLQSPPLPAPSTSFKEAKEAQILSLRQEIEHWKNLSPDKAKHYFNSMKEYLEDIIDLIQRQLNEAKSELDRKTKLLVASKENQDQSEMTIAEIIKERDELQEKVKTLEMKLDNYREREREDEEFNFRISSLSREKLYKPSDWEPLSDSEIYKSALDTIQKKLK